MASPSLKLADIANAKHVEPPIPFAEQTPQQRAILQAYWRARAQSEHEPVTVEHVAKVLTSDCVDWGIKKHEVEPILDELIEQGWALELVRRLRPKRPRSPKLKVPSSFGGEEHTVQRHPKKPTRPTRPRRPRAKAPKYSA
jgi:hypothetical protein